MNRHRSYFRKKNDRRLRTCPVCGKTFVRSDDEKGWRDHCKHLNSCTGKSK